MSRIVVFSHAGGSPQHGPNMRWYYLGRALKAHGYQVSIVSASWFHKYYAPPEVGREGRREIVKGVEYEWIKTRSYKKRGLGQVLNQLDYVRRAWKRINQLQNEDVKAVVASSPHPFVIYPALRYARRVGVPLLFETRDLWPKAIIELGRISKYHPYIQLLALTERFAVRKADRVVSVKPGDGMYFQEEYGLSEDQIFYVPNGFLQPKEERNVALNPPFERAASQTVIGYVGALSKAYRIDTFIDAAERLRGHSGIRFVIVGRGEDEEKHKEVVSRRRLTNVKFVGFRPREEIPAWLDAFDVCYVGLTDVPVYRLGISSNKVFEYMAAGKPIIAAYNTDFDPVAMGECGITIAPGNTNALVQAIEELSNDPDRARELGENGRRYFLENHEFSVVARKFCDVLDSLHESRSQL